MAKAFDTLVKRTTTKKTRRRAAARTRVLMQDFGTEVTEKAVDEFSAQQNQQVKDVEQALADAQAGRVLTEDEFDADMQTW